MESRRHKLECEIADLELILKWKGVPTFAFISGLAGLLWALFLEFTPQNYTEFPVLFSVLGSRVIWDILNDSFFSHTSLREGMNILKIFKKDIFNEVKFEILVDVTCLYFIRSIYLNDFFIYALYLYFITNTLMNCCAFFLNPTGQLAQNSVSVVSERLTWLENKWFILSQKWFAFIFKILLAGKILLIQGMTFNQARQCFIAVGIILLVQFYFTGGYFLTLLGEKRKQLCNLFESKQNV